MSLNTFIKLLVRLVGIGLFPLNTKYWHVVLKHDWYSISGKCKAAILIDLIKLKVLSSYEYVYLKFKIRNVPSSVKYHYIIVWSFKFCSFVEQRLVLFPRKLCISIQTGNNITVIYNTFLYLNLTLKASQKPHNETNTKLLWQKIPDKPTSVILWVQIIRLVVVVS